MLLQKIDLICHIQLVPRVDPLLDARQRALFHASKIRLQAHCRGCLPALSPWRTRCALVPLVVGVAPTESLCFQGGRRAAHGT